MMNDVKQMRADAAKVADLWATDLQRQHGGPAAAILALPLPPEPPLAEMEAALRQAVDEAVADDMDAWFANARDALALLDQWRTDHGDL